MCHLASNSLEESQQILIVDGLFQPPELMSVGAVAQGFGYDPRQHSALAGFRPFWGSREDSIQCVVVI